MKYLNYILVKQTYILTLIYLTLIMYIPDLSNGLWVWFCWQVDKIDTLPIPIFYLWLLPCNLREYSLWHYPKTESFIHSPKDHYWLIDTQIILFENMFPFIILEDPFSQLTGITSVDLHLWRVLIESKSLSNMTIMQYLHIYFAHLLSNYFAFFSDFIVDVKILTYSHENSWHIDEMG